MGYPSFKITSPRSIFSIRRGADKFESRQICTLIKGLLCYIHDIIRKRGNSLAKNRDNSLTYTFRNFKQRPCNQILIAYFNSLGLYVVILKGMYKVCWILTKIEYLVNIIHILLFTLYKHLYC